MVENPTHTRQRDVVLCGLPGEAESHNINSEDGLQNDSHSFAEQQLAHVCSADSVHEKLRSSSGEHQPQPSVMNSGRSAPLAQQSSLLASESRPIQQSSLNHARPARVIQQSSLPVFESEPVSQPSVNHLTPARDTLNILNSHFVRGSVVQQGSVTAGQPSITTNSQNILQPNANEQATSLVRLERWQGHRDYGVSILDDTVNQWNPMLHTYINRSIATVLMSRGDAAVATNIGDKDYKIRRWQLNRLSEQLGAASLKPDNVVVPQCKLHNDSSVSLSDCGTLLAAFVPTGTYQGRCILSVFSTTPGSNFARCLFTHRFGPNAITVSFSPRSSDLLLVGLASRRLHVYSRQQVVGQALRLVRSGEGEASCEDLGQLRHLAQEPDPSAHVSINAATWLPEPHAGLAYATITGQIFVARPWVGAEDERLLKTVGTQTRPVARHITDQLSEMLGLVDEDAGVRF